MFTDPITKVGGEKCSYMVPTYESIKGMLKSIYWKPTLIWYVDRVRVLKMIQTQTKGVKPLKWESSQSDLSYYTYLKDVCYQVEAHFEWNTFRPELEQDRVDGKHFAIAERMIERGGRQDVFLGVRDCQAYVEPCKFGEGEGHYDDVPELALGLMFHGFDYPDETELDGLYARLWSPKLRHGIIDFLRPEDCDVRRFIRDMETKSFQIDENITTVSKVDLS